VAPNENGAVWFDITVPRDQEPGRYEGEVTVREGKTNLATLPIELVVDSHVLPDRAMKTMLYYEHDELDRRIGDGDAAEEHLFKLLRRHPLTPMHSASSRGDVTRQLPALDGSLYTAERGYEGPGENEGDGILSLGSYGELDHPSDSLDLVEQIAAMLDKRGLFATTDVFLYADDENCGSSLGGEWTRALAGASPVPRKVKVGWTCG